MKLILKNNVDKSEFEFTVTDTENSTMFYEFSISLESNMSEGEYTYFLYDTDNKLVAEGLCQIGDYVLTPQEQPIYNNNNSEYIQYNE